MVPVVSNDPRTLVDLTSECLRAVDSSSYEDSTADLGYGQMYAQTCCLNFTPTGPPTRTVDLPRITGPRPNEPGSVAGLPLEGRLKERELEALGAQ